MKLRIPLLILLAAGMLLSCQEKVREEFLASPNLCLEYNGRVIFTYNPVNSQLSCNRSACRFRVMDDTASSYYQLTCSEMPQTVGQTVTADILWSAGDSAENLAALEFRVEKVEGNKVWLWCARRKIAVSVMVIDT